MGTLHAAHPAYLAIWGATWFPPSSKRSTENDYHDRADARTAGQASVSTAIG